jgi:endonuclease/exonuclease/phosphatase family metal-dependent hydrolase
VIPLKRILLLVLVFLIIVALAGVVYYAFQRNPELSSAIRAEVGALLPDDETISRPTPSTPAGTLRLASFNVLHLGWNNGKDLSKLAQILARYDVIALQEVMKKSGGARDPLVDLKTVRRELEAFTGSSWAFQATPGPIGRKTYREYYAILYRTDRVAFTGESRVFSDPNDTFIREPFYATFRAGNFDFTLVTMHAIGPGDETLDDEIRALQDVFENIQNESVCEDDVLLVGDFNTPAGDGDWAALRAIPPMTNLIPAATKTSIGIKGIANAYDNIWMQGNHTSREFTGRVGAYYFFEDLYAERENPYKAAREELSDHVPVWAKFQTALSDDDGCN